MKALLAATDSRRRPYNTIKEARAVMDRYRDLHVAAGWVFTSTSYGEKDKKTEGYLLKPKGSVGMVKAISLGRLSGDR